MCEEKIRAVVTQFAKEAEKIYGAVLRAVILYGSFARGILQTIVISTLWFCWMLGRMRSG